MRRWSSMLSVSKARELLGSDAPPADADVEALLEQARALARLIVEVFRESRKERPSA